MGDTSVTKIPSGIAGLDEVLYGGFLLQRTYLLRGGPGTGKTTIGLHFLSEGLRRGEKGLYISFEETRERIVNDAQSMGIDVEGIEFLDLSPSSQYFAEVESYDIFSPAEVEREPMTKKITSTIESMKPHRVVLDPISQLRYLSTDVFQFRKQVLSFLRFLTEQGATVLFTSEGSTSIPDDDLQFMADGIIELENTDYGRFLTVLKFRGAPSMEGKHSMKFYEKGIQVFPRLVPQRHGVRFTYDIIPSGVSELDTLLHGGLERGTVTFIVGPTGIGKTTLGLQFMKEAAARGERSVLFSFEEETDILLHRAEAVKINARHMIDQGTLLIQKVNPLQYTPDEFFHYVRNEVEVHKARIVMIDSVQGYRLNMKGRDLESHLFALTRYLQNMGVATFLIIETTKLTGDFVVTDLAVSYMADNILFLRYIEINGQLRRALGVLKKRLSDFEKTLREFTITPNGINIGQPFYHLHGIITGAPYTRKLDNIGE